MQKQWYASMKLFNALVYRKMAGPPGVGIGKL